MYPDTRAKTSLNCAHQQQYLYPGVLGGRGDGTSSELPYPGVSTKQIFLSKTSPTLSLRARGGLVVLTSRSVSRVHHAGYARVLALISRIFSVGGMTFVSSVARRERDGLRNDDEEDMEEEDDVAG